MSEPVLIRGHVPLWLTVCRILAALSALVGLLLTFTGPKDVGTVLAIVSGGLWMLLEISAALQRSKREWIEDTSDGFIHTTKTGEEALSDQQVSSIAFEHKKLFVNGTAKNVQRTCRLWIDDDESPIVLLNRFPLEAPDPLYDLLTRLSQQVHERNTAILAEGGDIDGDGWWMNREELHVGAGRQELVVPLVEIAECAAFDNQMCLWQRGEDEAFAKFPVGSRNACQLPLLLAEHLQKNSAEDSESASTDAPGLGRILFERKAKAITRILVMGFALITGLMSLGLMLGAPEVIVKLFGGLLALLTIALLYAAHAMKRSVFRCHQRGVHKIGLFGERQLRYSDVESFTYSATRHYHNGAYVGTHINMKFEPLPEAQSKPLAYNTSVNGEDASLEELRDFISRAIASRMADRLASGKRVKWTDNLAFLPDGIEFRRGGFIGRKAAEVLPLTDYQGYSLDQGTFALFQKEVKKPLMTESASAKNFFPGFFLLQLLLHVPGAEPQPAQEPLDELDEALDELPEA